MFAPMQKARQYSQPLTLANAVQFNDSDEGGLDLDQVLGAIRRQGLLIAGVTTLVASAAILKTLIDGPVYQSKFEILTEPVTVETQVISSANPQTLSNREEVVAVRADEVKLKILKSPRVINHIVEQLQTQYPDISYDDLVEKLKIKTVGENADILEVTYQNKDLELVRNVVDLVAKAYLKYSLEERQTDIRRGIVFVEKQLPQLRSRVETQQDQLQKLRQKHNLVDPETKAKQLSSQIGAVEQQRLDTQLQLNEAKSLYAYLQKELAQQPAELAAASVLSENSRYQGLLNQLLEIDTQMARESVLFLEKSAESEILREQRQNLLPLLHREEQRVAREIASRIRDLEARNQILTKTLERLNQQVKQLSVITREYTDIERELLIATDNLNQFLAKREALQIDVAQREVPWQLLAPPSEPQPSSASVKKNLVLGTILGLLLGLGAALAVDKLRNILYTSKEIKDITGLPLLGVIPFKKELEEFALAEDVTVSIQQAESKLELGNGHKPKRYPASPFFEAFRSLYTNICLLSPDSPTRSLVISSAAPAEGKSTVAIHLARAAAAMGQRVLLVDTDLRHPNLHNRLELMNMRGLTNIISTENLDFNNVILRSPLEDNLFVLTAGSVPPDPIRFLASQKMKDLMEQLQVAFDLVIYDAPPLLGLADVPLLAAQTNGVVLVAGLGKLKRSLLEQTLDELKVSGTPILGLVANGSQVRQQYYTQKHKLQKQSETTVG